MKQRRVLIGVLLLLSILYVTAESSDRLSVIKTAYFDFIFPTASAESAAFLASSADGLADEICGLLDTRMKERIPVYLNPDIQLTNAYFSPYPYNHIVLYDISPTDDTLGSYHNALLKIFYHELTHAVSLNIRGPVTQFFSDIFGDPLSANLLITMPMSFLEGVTVSLESRDGDGRLADPYVRHFFVQDKLEGKFLSWKDSAGARDIYPGRQSAYLYGGAFSAWLQKTYGMEAYARLWRKGAKFNPFTGYLQIRFAQVYGITLDKAWAAFADSIEVPSDVQSNSDILPGTREGLYSSLASGPDGLVWYDANHSGVFFRLNEGRIQRLFDADYGLNRLTVSPDGRLLLVSDLRFSGKDIRTRVRLFDMDRRKFTGEEWLGLREASFVGSASSVCAIEAFSQRSDLVVFDRTDPANKRILLTAGNGERFYSLYSPVSAGTGRLSCIAANGLDRKLLLIDIGSGAVSDVVLPAEVQAIRFLHSAQTTLGTALSFCWSKPDSLYRGALYYPESGELKLQAPDFSGGVFYPVTEPATEGDSLVYAASFSGVNRLLRLGPETFGQALSVMVRPLESGFVAQSPATGTVHADVKSPEAVPSFAVSGTQSNFSSLSPYHPLPWFLDGIFIPFPTMLPIHNSTMDAAPGFLYLTGDPTERYNLLINPAISADPFFIDYSCNAVVNLQPFSVMVKLSDHLMPKLGSFNPYRDMTAGINVKRIQYLDAAWKTLTVNLGGTGHIFAPDIDSTESPYKAGFSASSAAATLEMTFADLHTRKIPDFHLGAVYTTGCSLSSLGYYGRAFPDNEPTSVFQASAVVQTPFIPLALTLSGAASDGLLFSPTAIFAEAKSSREFHAGVVRYVPLFSEYDNTGYEMHISDRLLGFDVALTPFRLEIQRGLPVLPLYTNRLLYVVGYRSALFDVGGTSPWYIDSVYTRVTLQSSTLIGLLTNVVISGNAEYAYPLREGIGKLLFSLTYMIVY